MEIYSGSVFNVLDGENIRCNIVKEGQSLGVKNIRLAKIQAPNIKKVYHTSLEGGFGLQLLYYVKKWFYDRSPVLTIEIENIDICGRWFGYIYAVGDEKSLNNYMLDLNLRDDYWKNEKQIEQKEEWFSGGVVTVPQGGQLPEFHTWGKMTNKAGRSNQTGRL